jgi:MYXO-CTERM domain-containing protein
MIIWRVNCALLAASLVTLPAALSAQTDPAVSRQANKVAAEANKLTSETAKLNNVVANETQAAQNNNAAYAASNGVNNGDDDGDHHRDRDDGHGKWGLLGLLGLAGLLGLRRRNDHLGHHDAGRRDHDDPRTVGTTTRSPGTRTDTRL